MVLYKCMNCKKTRKFKRVGNCALKHCTKYHNGEVYFKKIENNSTGVLKKWE